MPNHSTIVSERFCCKYCQSDVAIEVEPGGDLSYVCQNERCKWACSVDCLEALAFKPQPLTPAPMALGAATYVQRAAQASDPSTALLNEQSAERELAGANAYTHSIEIVRLAR